MKRTTAFGILALTSGLLASGCHSVPYESLVVSGDRFAALHPGPDDFMRVFYIHGMGAQEPDYAHAFARDLAGRFGYVEVGPDPAETHDVNDAEGYRGILQFPRPAQLTIYRFGKPGGPVQLVFYQFRWETLTAGDSGIKQRVLADDEAVPRALANEYLKVGKDHVSGIMDDALADVVLYIEHYHSDVIARAAVNAVGSFIKGEYDGRHAQSGQTQVAFFSHSLGSAILCDALSIYAEQSIRKHAGRHGFAARLEAVDLSSVPSEAPQIVRDRDPDGTRFATTLSQTRFIYMFANQIPFLDLASMDDEPLRARESPGSAPDARAPAPKGRIAKLARYYDLLMGPGAALQLVAFSDPNDLLTFQLYDKPPGANINLVNVRLRNAGDLMGYLEDPLTAHTGYPSNEKVVDLVVNGYP